MDAMAGDRPGTFPRDSPGRPRAWPGPAPINRARSRHRPRGGTMPEVDLTSIFNHMPTESTDGHNASLLTLLNTVSGATITDDATLNRQLKQGAITVISVFQPNPCTAGATHGTTGPGGGSGSSPPATAPAPPN